MNGEYWVGVGVAAQGFPRNGFGGGSAQRVAANAVSDLTRDSVVLPGANLGSVTAGDYIFTQNGYYGIVKTADNVSKLVTLHGDWRVTISGIPRSGQIPSGVTTATIHTGNHSAASATGQLTQVRPVNIRRVLIGNHAAAGSLVITDAGGTAVLSVTLPDPASKNMTGETIEIGLRIRGPWGYTTSGASNVFYMLYDMDSETAA